MTTPLHPEILTWTALLGRWVEFAQASLALPDADDGPRWRASVPAVIALQAVTFALRDLASVPAAERPLARDRAALLIGEHAGALDDAWRGTPLPEALRPLAADARAALADALYAGAVELVWRGPGAFVVPDVPVGAPAGTLAVMQPGTLAFPGEPVAWWNERDADDLRAALAAAEVTRPALPRQVYRQLGATGAIERDVVVPVTADPRPGLPLLVPLCANGGAIGTFTLDAAVWEAQQRQALGDGAPQVVVEGAAEVDPAEQPYTLRMADIHPSAIIDGDVDLAGDVVVGPGCVLTGPVTVGAGTRLIGHVYLNGPLRLGAGNVLYPNVALGFAPQSISYDADAPGAGLVVGDRNTFREGVTVHRAMTDGGPTTVGDGNFFMVNSHVGHDCRLGNRGVFANGTLIAGHAIVGDRVTTGGHSAVHQFVRVGRGAMISGLSAPTLDVLPFMIITGINVCPAPNLVGLRRHDMSRDEIDAVRWVHRTVCRSGLAPASALACLRERAAEPLVAEYIAFAEASERGICTGRAPIRRGVNAS